MATKTLDYYQEEAKSWLLNTGKLVGLFDEPGVGKTGPAVVAAAGLIPRVNTGTRYLPNMQPPRDRPVLVTCPAYLCEQWQREILAFTDLPSSGVLLANGQGYDARTEALQSDALYVITSYANWSAKFPSSHPQAGQFQYPELAERRWSALIFDEAHRLRGRNSQCTKHVGKLRLRNSTNRDTPIWLLTGTPIVNNPGDLFPFLNLMDRKTYGSYWKFIERYCLTWTTPYGTEVGQLRPEMAEEFHNLLSAFALRRTVDQIPILKNLAVVHHDHYVTMPASVRKTIAKAKKDYVVEHPDVIGSEFVNGSGALYVKLRQLATNPPTKEKPKIDFLRDFLEDHQERLVVYTWFKDSANEVVAQLAGKRPVYLISGDVPTAERQREVDTWSEDPAGVLVATISALKEGISLTAANTMVFLEHSELPADQEQCVARLKRRGQETLVNVHHVIAKGTPDVAIERALTDREMGLKRALVEWIKEDD